MQRRETRVKGIDACVSGLQGLFKGANTGKTVISVSPLEQTASKL
jgi:NADPH-dependent curcumin reductase CurA